MTTSLRTRYAHQVLRTTNLQKTLTFLTNTFGMTIFRHEENRSPCGMTCNGPFDRPWSKTMVGFPGRLEDTNFALEVTYNYGIRRYDDDGGLAMIVIGGGSNEEEDEDDVREILKRAEEGGYKVIFPGEEEEEGDIIGPDGYIYRVRRMENEDRKERFLSVNFNVSSTAVLSEMTKVYTDILQLETLQKMTGGDNGGNIEDVTGVVLGHKDKVDGVSLVFQVSDGEVSPGAKSGRICLCQEDVKARYDACVDYMGKECVLHERDILEDKLGDLEIGIVKDVSGYEICLVTDDVFGKLAREATDFVGPDYDLRKEYGARDGVVGDD